MPLVVEEYGHIYGRGKKRGIPYQCRGLTGIGLATCIRRHRGLRRTRPFIRSGFIPAKGPIYRELRERARRSATVVPHICKPIKRGFSIRCAVPRPAIAAETRGPFRVIVKVRDRSLAEHIKNLIKGLGGRVYIKAGRFIVADIDRAILGKLRRITRAIQKITILPSEAKPSPTLEGQEEEVYSYGETGDGYIDEVEEEEEEEVYEATW